MSFWEEPEQVKQFAERDPDHRLIKLIKEYKQPQLTTVLDLGCAGGRNAVLLAEMGFDIYAIDGSYAMVEETRERVKKILGEESAKKRIRQGSMNDLSFYQSGYFDLIIALGIFQNAISHKEWFSSLAEASRVLKTKGKMLVANFHVKSAPDGNLLVKDNSETHVYHGFGPNPMYLLNAEQHDAQFLSFGFVPLLPTETVKAATANGYRITINSIYQKST